MACETGVGFRLVPGTWLAICGVCVCVCVLWGVFGRAGVRYLSFSL